MTVCSSSDGFLLEVESKVLTRVGRIMNKEGMILVSCTISTLNPWWTFFYTNSRSFGYKAYYLEKFQTSQVKIRILTAKWNFFLWSCKYAFPFGVKRFKLFFLLKTSEIKLKLHINVKININIIVTKHKMRSISSNKFVYVAVTKWENFFKSFRWR